MILMYHHVCPAEEVPASPEPMEGWEWRISPEGLEKQLQGFGRLGYRFVTLSELVEEIRKNGKEPEKAVAISFDDGWVDNFTHAFPILRRVGAPATFFVTTSHLRDGNDGKRMSAGQLRELAKAGMTIGGHSRTHRNLALLNEGEAKGEIAGCKEDLESVLETPVMFFAYPFGAHNRMAMRLAREAGYEAACSGWGGAVNTRSVMYRLYRDDLTPGLDAPSDRRAMSGFWRRVVGMKRGVRSMVGRLMAKGPRDR